MAYTVNLDQRKGAQLQSKKDSSTVPIPGGTCKDLSNCPGSLTHVKGQYAFNLNVLENCIPKGIGLQASTSGLVALGAPSSNLYEYSDATLDTNVLKLLQYATGSIAQNGVINNALLIDKAIIATALGADAASVTIEILGANINVYSAGANPRLIATIQRPAVYPLLDQCETAVGFTASISTQIQGFDPETCRPTLVWQNSTKLSFNSALYSADYQTAPTQAVLVTKLRDILQAGAADGEDICDNVGPNMEALWLSLFNQPLLIGTADG